MKNGLIALSGLTFLALGTAANAQVDVTAFTSSAASAEGITQDMFTSIAPVVASVVLLGMAISIGKTMLKKAKP